MDSIRLPVVSDGDGRVTVWTFGGGASSSSIARELALSGVTVIGFDALEDPGVVRRDNGPLAVHPLGRRAPRAPEPESMTIILAGFADLGD